MPTTVSKELSSTAYVVLGLLASLGPSTPYELKRALADSVGFLWPFPHSQVYAEPRRLADRGLVAERRERSGRRRRIYSITPAGRRELLRWLRGRAAPAPELRDTGLLKLFFGTGASPEDIRRLAKDRYESHRDRADGYQRQREQVAGVADRWQLKTIELGLRYERTVEQFWKDFIEELDRDPP